MLETVREDNRRKVLVKIGGNSFVLSLNIEAAGRKENHCKQARNLTQREK